MLYRILRELGSLDSAKRAAAIRMARGLPWEDFEQILALYDKSRKDACKGLLTLLTLILLVGLSSVILMKPELPHNLFIPAISVVLILPVPLIIGYFSTQSRAHHGLMKILDEVDDPAFVSVALGALSERHADHYSFRNDLLNAIRRLLPEITIESTSDWTHEERYGLSHGLNSVLPLTAGGRDALTHSHSDFVILILKVLQRIGDSREVELVRLVSTIDPTTEAHQKIREASIKCLKSIDKRTHAVTGTDAMEPALPPHVQFQPIKRSARVEMDLGHLLKSSAKNQPVSSTSAANENV